MKYPQRRKYNFAEFPLVCSVEWLNDTTDIVLWGGSEFFSAALPRYSDFADAIEKSKTESDRQRLASLKFRINENSGKGD